MHFTQYIKGHLALARVSNSPTVLTNVLAGAALAGTLWHAHLAVVAVAMVLFYTAGMYLNDVFDVAVDRAQRPERPLPAGAVTLRCALLVAILLLLAGLALLASVSLAVLSGGLVLASVITVYDAWHKSNPVAPVLMASTRGLVYVIAYLAVQPAVSLTLAWAVIIVFCYVMGLTSIAASETRQSFTGRWPVLCLFAPIVYFAWTLPLGWQWGLVALFALWVTWSIRLVYQGSIPTGITQLIAGIALVDALILAAAGEAVGCAVALVAFALTLLLQRFVKGT